MLEHAPRAGWCRARASTSAYERVRFLRVARHASADGSDSGFLNLMLAGFNSSTRYLHHARARRRDPTLRRSVSRRDPGRGYQEEYVESRIVVVTHSDLGFDVAASKNDMKIPHGCITASALRTLASSLDRLAAFHRERGGPAPESPCLVEVRLDDDQVVARVSSNSHVYRLVLIHGAWEFR